MTNQFSLYSEARERIAARKAQVMAVGLGYVGLPLALTIHESGFPTLGLDLDAERVEAINAGAQVISYFQADRIKTAMRLAMAAPIDLRNDFDSVSLRRAKRIWTRPRSSSAGVGRLRWWQQDGCVADRRRRIDHSRLARTPADRTGCRWEVGAPSALRRSPAGN